MSLFPSSSPPQDATARKNALMRTVTEELALTNAQQLMTETCITKPSTSLSSTEQTCLSQCLDRYLDAFNIVRRTYLGRIAQERRDAADQAHVIV
ncbi:zf-Tim10-DDP domain-containing protein [Mycena kentingensis (nom. inval.)]|nr:zf-Tim10-DDP domain-containing protein [Mycena kentingensis (nom. inval.)]